MAEALRQAGRARGVSALPAPGPRAVPDFHPESAAVTPFPSAPRPRSEESEDGDRRWALLLLAVTLLLMLSVIATGWFLIGGDTLPETQGAAKTSRIEPEP